MQKCILAAAALIAVSACSPGTTKPAAPADATAALDAELDRMIAFRVDEQHMATGVVVGIIRPEGVRYHAYGSTLRDGGEEVDENTVYDIGSLTKIFTSLLLSEAVSRGELGLDDTIDAHLPEGVSAPHFDGEPIRLVDLATHTSGLPLRPPNLVSADPENPYAGYAKEGMYDALKEIELSAKPGTQFQYSNLAYGLLGDILARSAGADYDALLHERILSPLDLRDTALGAPAENKASRTAQGYDVELNPATRWDMGALAPAGGLSSTAADIVKFLDYVINPPTPEASAAVDRMFSVSRPADQPNTIIGLGWRVTPARDESGDVIWSNGSVGGFRAFMAFNRRTKTGVVALANASTGLGVDDIGFHSLDALYPVDMTPPIDHTEIKLTAAEIDRLVGNYKSDVDDEIVGIRRDGDKIFCSIGGGEVEVFAEAPNALFLKVVEATLTFDLPAAGGFATHLVWRQSGVEYHYRRISS